MPNNIYPAYKTSVMIADANVNLNVHTATDWVAVSLQTGYTYNSAHQFMTSVTTAAGTDQQITSSGGAPTVTAGTFIGTDVLTWTALPSGPAVNNLVIYRRAAGGAGTNRLVVYFDTGISPLPLTPNGGNVTLTFSPSGIFTI